MVLKICNTEQELQCTGLGLDTDIAENVKCYKISTQHKTTQHILPMLIRDVPEGHWQDLTTDFLKFNNKAYLIIANAFSKYPFTFKMSTIAADKVAHKFTQIFSQNGTPKHLSTDNGPPFSSETFAKFLSNQRVDYITSSPHYPKSYGFIKWQIKTIKTALATLTASRKTLHNLLLSLRPYIMTFASMGKQKNNMTDTSCNYSIGSQ